MRPSTAEPGPVREAGAGLAALASFAARLEIAALPAAVTRQAQACLLYGLVVGIASTKAEAPRIAAAARDFETAGAAGKATCFIDGKRVAIGEAAFCNAALFHARIQEDAHPAGHVGVVVVPAALAVAERLGAGGADLLCAIVAGYEVALRIGRDHAADASTRGFRTTPIYGVFGAAAAASRLMGLGAERTRNALALAANLACGLREFVNAGTGEYPFHAGFAARNGISAAICAQARAVAAPGSIDGSAGFYASHGEAGKDYGARLNEALGMEFELLQVTYKPYPTCQFHRSVVRGVLALRARLEHRALRTMTIRMHPFEADFVGVRYAGPFGTFSQTFMSAPFCAALAWSKGIVGYDGLHDFDDVEVLRQVARIEVVSDPARPRYQPRISVSAADGTVEEWQETLGPEAFGLTWEAAVEMAGRLCGEANVSASTGAALISAVDRIAEASDIGAMVAATNAAVLESVLNR